MGYQALLSSPDEKLARVVTQVFAELDFAIEPAPEPFDAVKRLMAQHYDAVVVDCENEQNASLLFKSARNSSFNQGSLTIALVEGQAGVAKAYRIGANLVLTKPINIEQAKGTLRVARGLLRKNSDAAVNSVPTVAGPTMPASAAPPPAASSSPTGLSPWGRPAEIATAPPAGPSVFPESETPLRAAIPDASPAGFPDMAAASNVAIQPSVPPPAAPIRITMADEPLRPAAPPISPDIIRNDGSTTAMARNETAKTASAPLPAQNTASAFTFPGSGAAPAPAKKVTSVPAKDNKKVEFEPTIRSHDAAPKLSSVSAADSPLFATLGHQEHGEDSAESGGNKRILIAAVIVLALIGVGYFGYGKLSKSTAVTPAPQPVSAPQDSAPPASTPAPVLEPMSSPQVAPSPGPPNRASSPTQTLAPKTATATARDTPPSPGVGTRPEIRIALAPGSETKKPSATPLFVKSNPTETKTQVSSQDNPLAVAPALITSNDSALSGLMSSASSGLPKPSLATPKISQGVTQGLLIKRVQPKYPPAALSIHSQGAVQIAATITREGNVTNLKVLSGDPVLSRAALEAVRQWRYKPYYLDGQPVEIETQITVNFKAN